MPSSPKNMSFGLILRLLRLERNWTQAELGEKLALPTTYPHIDEIIY